MIQLYHVYKRFENGKDALVDVTLRVREGEFLFLTGASGAGKSTLLRLLLVMDRVTEGQVLIGGRNVHVLRDASVPYLRRNIGLVFQDFRLLDRRSVFDNVAIAMEILGLGRADVERRVMQLLSDLGLEDRARAMPSALSGGERQRVALARALANEPAILLADEPTGNLDLDLSIEIMDLLQEINRKGTTVVVATHDYGLVDRYGLRTVHLENGRLVEDRARSKHEPPAPHRRGERLPTGKVPAAPPPKTPAEKVAARRASGNVPRIQPGQLVAPRHASSGFTAANVRLNAARITGPIRPGMIGEPAPPTDTDDADPEAST